MCLNAVELGFILCGEVLKWQLAKKDLHTYTYRNRPELERRIGQVVHWY